MNDAVIVSLLSVVPKNRLARLMGSLSRTRLPGLIQRFILRTYIRWYGVNTEECEGTVADYPSLSAFFVRTLKPGVRPIDAAAEVVVSPVDGHVHTIGTIKGGSYEQAPGVASSVGLLLGGDPQAEQQALALEGGAYAVLYLAPKDYHRVHVAREGQLVSARYKPGKLWPVFPSATRSITDLFGKNERLSFCQQTDLGQVHTVMVGAFGVGRITSPHLPIKSNTGAPEATIPLEPPIELGRGDELGCFEMGSTVVLLLEPGTIGWEIDPGVDVKLGQVIGRQV